VVADYSRENGRVLKELRIANDTLLEYDKNLCRKLSNVIPFINQDYIDTWPILSERRDPLWKNVMSFV
ncbi:9139_t:CDS:2, partial [Entrophospora sp. SA101]